MRSCRVRLGYLALCTLLQLAGASPLTVFYQLQEQRDAKGLQQVACMLPRAVPSHFSIQLPSFFRASQTIKEKVACCITLCKKCFGITDCKNVSQLCAQRWRFFSGQNIPFQQVYFSAVSLTCLQLLSYNPPLKPRNRVIGRALVCYITLLGTVMRTLNLYCWSQI